MTARFTSTVASPADRGEEFGSRYAVEVAATVEVYRRLFSAAGPVDVARLGEQALERIEAFAPELSREIRGIAGGAGVPASHVAAINARTEILATMASLAGRGECSTVVCLGGDEDEPVAMQTWDWYTDLADKWLEWTIPFDDGRRIVTVTEYGILGKIGVNSFGVGVLFNILHHRDDGTGLGVPVHAIARQILQTAPNVHSGLKVAAAARTSASTSITLIGSRKAGKTAVAVELWPGGPGHVLPTAEGLLVRTNHFLSEPARSGDIGWWSGPDTLVRYDVLRRRLHPYRGRADAGEVLAALTDHTGGVCCHPDPTEDPPVATLATVALDVADGAVTAHAGGPCTFGERD
jgi:isopenicillin-N N-acyltransferase-like protein